MVCQDCNKREVQVKFTQIVNNQKTTLAFCNECAAARGFHSPLENAPFQLSEILSGLAAAHPTMDDTMVRESLVCPGCGLTFEDFASQGRFACGECYRAFRPRLEAIMRKIHGSSLHRGQAPDQEPLSQNEAPVIPVREEERLAAELHKAVENEEFERAAEIRDKLKMIRGAQTVEK